MQEKNKKNDDLAPIDFEAMARDIQKRAKARRESDATDMATHEANTSVAPILEAPEAPKLSTPRRHSLRLPEKSPEDIVLRLEQNLGCELPVCVSNRRDVHKDHIAVAIDGETIWKLVRTTDSLLPAPEHYRIWMWLLDRFHAAARTNNKSPPRIAINLAELARGVGAKPNGRWYEDVDEALSRFSSLVIKVGQACYIASDGTAVTQTGALGTLCSYVSWRTTDPSSQLTLVDGVDGWVMPGSFLWESILSDYLKAIPLEHIRQLRAYVAQRLLTYLAKHCRPGHTFKVSLNKLLPRIPINCFGFEAIRRLAPHHQALLDVGFLSSAPVYEGRGRTQMVTYVRADSDY